MKITIMTVNDYTESNEGVPLLTKVFPGHLNELEMTEAANVVAEQDGYDQVEQVCKDKSFHGFYHNFECDSEPVSVSIDFEYTQMETIEDFVGEDFIG